MAGGVFYDQFGRSWREPAAGEGVIEVAEGSVFEPVVTLHGIRLQQAAR